MAADLVERVDRAIEAGMVPGLHSVAVVRRDAIVLERYRAGADCCWGEPLGLVQHGPWTLHDLRSMTKSLVGLVYGIALDRGLVPSTETPLVDALPRYADLCDADRRRITVGHALSMTMGTEWDETLAYSDPANSEIRMERAPDRLRFALDRPIIEPPGQRWVYNGGASALLGGIIAAHTGRSLEDFTREVLFTPLGIERFEWSAGSDGIVSAASGLRLELRSLARIGMMLLDGGCYRGRRIVPAGWLATSTARHAEIDGSMDYGYQWWLGRAPVGARSPEPRNWFAAFGNGGQRLFVLPSADVALMTFFGNYDQPDDWLPPYRLWREIVLPSVMDI